MEIRVPWRARTAAYTIYQHSRSLLSRLTTNKRHGLAISFYCNYHQATGSTVAIASIANHLATIHNVDAYIEPLSSYTRLLELNVRQYPSPERLAGKLVFVDIEQDNRAVEALARDGHCVILTCHALPTVLHNVPQDQLIRNLELSSWIHFVSHSQRLAFIEHYPQINIEQKSFYIPNYTRQSTKSTTTGNVGIVGHLNRKVKNALEGIQLAQQSDARLIQCWGSNTIAGLENHKLYSKLRINGWANSTSDMHDSFDVLVSTSQFESFGLVVVEALSAGIPCVLSDIPVFRELFADCSGVAIITGNDRQDIQAINDFLAQAAELKDEIIEFWESRFSDESINAKWQDKLEHISRHT